MARASKQQDFMKRSIEMVEEARIVNAAVIEEMEHDYNDTDMQIDEFFRKWGYDALSLAIIGAKWGV